MTDNGIENEIEGPLKGFDSRYAFKTKGTVISEGLTQNSLTASYGQQEFENVHLAQSSGRAHELVNDNNNRYTGVSTEEAAQRYNANTYIMLIGTNDLLSDSGYTEANFADKMDNLLGGTVTYNEESKEYSWNGTIGGNMYTAVSDVLNEETDKLYLMTVPCWTDHGNNNSETSHHAVEEYNRLLGQWVDAYNESHRTGSGEGQVILVDVNRGLIDMTADISFKGHQNFFNNPGTDGLHPNEQGSLIIAGNLARAMNIGGRTAGLTRADKSTAGTTWSTATVGSDGTIAAGETLSAAKYAFTEDGGYTVDFRATFGNGATDGTWLDSSHALSISIGDGTNSGTLNLSEGYIMWGDSVLFCQDNSAMDENLRIAWHNGNTTDNVLAGYYVWLGDMLIGQGLEADATGSGLNGISFSATGASGSITDLSWSNTAYAPTTMLTTSTEHAYKVTQQAGETALITNSGVNYDGATTTTATADANTYLVTTTGSTTDTYTGILANAEGSESTEVSSWYGMTNSAYKGTINLQHQGNISATIFGTMNNGDAGKLVLEIAEGAAIGTSGKYSENSIEYTAAIAGSFGGGDAESFNVYVNGGSIGGDVVGGAINGAGVIDEVSLAFNGGTIDASVYGGSKVSGGTVGKADIVVNGGTIIGNIVAGGSAGTIGQVEVTITDGTIGGNITKGEATRTAGATTNVTIIGNKASIGGNIEADTVTLRDVQSSTSDSGFDKYAHTITAKSLVLDNVQTEVLASVNVKELSMTNGTNTSLILGDIATLESLTLDAHTTFGAFKAADARTVESNSETTLTLTTLTVAKGATLNANIILGADSTLNLAGCLTMGSTVSLTSGMTINLSEELLALMYKGETIDIFTSVDALTLDGETISPDTVTKVSFNVDHQLRNFNMGYSNVGTVSITLVPEPATATLSLMALAALALRRRRK